MKSAIKLVLIISVSFFINQSLHAQGLNKLIIGTWKEDGRGSVGQDNKPNTISPSTYNNKWTFTKDSIYYVSVDKKATDARNKYELKDSTLFFFNDPKYKVEKLTTGEMIIVSIPGNKAGVLGFPVSGVAVRLKRVGK